MKAFGGNFFDGNTAYRHSVIAELDLEAQILCISGDTLNATLSWPLEQLRIISGAPRDAEVILTLTTNDPDEMGRDTSRLVITDDNLNSQLLKYCPSIFQTDITTGTARKVITRVTVAITALILMLFFILPKMADTLATIIPIEREIAFGKVVVTQMERLLSTPSSKELSCENIKGREALNNLVLRLTREQNLQYDLTVNIFDHQMLNAFAAPGGQIVIMRGLLDAATSTEAVAAIIAHEIGHVESRDATRHSLRAAGSAGLLAMIFGDVAGGSVIVILADYIMQAGYTKEAEERADSFAISMLNNAAIGTGGMAELFETLNTLENPILTDLPDYFATHPSSQYRASLARENASEHTIDTKKSNMESLRYLQSICDD